MGEEILRGQLICDVMKLNKFGTIHDISNFPLFIQRLERRTLDEHTIIS